MKAHAIRIGKWIWVKLKQSPKILILRSVRALLIGSTLLVLAVAGKLGLDHYIRTKLAPDIISVTLGELPPILNKSDGILGLKQVKITSLDETRVVRLIGEVNSRKAKEVILKLAELNEESSLPITLVINSPGGSVLDGAEIIGAIESSRARINTVCVSICASMGALIHQYGKSRQIFAHAVLMFHPAYGMAFDDVDRMDSMITMIKRYVNKMEVNAAMRSKMTFEEFKAKSAVQIWVDGEDAVHQKLADEVVFYRNNTIREIYEEIKKSNDDSDSSLRRRKLRMLLKSSLSYLLSYFESNNLDERLRDDFNDMNKKGQ